MLLVFCCHFKRNISKYINKDHNENLSIIHSGRGLPGPMFFLFVPVPLRILTENSVHLTPSFHMTDEK
jgi:hypothetical protein